MLFGQQAELQSPIGLEVSTRLHTNNLLVCQDSQMQRPWSIRQIASCQVYESGLITFHSVSDGVRLVLRVLHLARSMKTLIGKTLSLWLSCRSSVCWLKLKAALAAAD